MSFWNLFFHKSSLTLLGAGTCTDCKMQCAKSYDENIRQPDFCHNPSSDKYCQSWCALKLIRRPTTWKVYGGSWRSMRQQFLDLQSRPAAAAGWFQRLVASPRYLASVAGAVCTGLDRASGRWQRGRFPPCRTSCCSCWKCRTTSLCHMPTTNTAPVTVAYDN